MIDDQRFDTTLRLLRLSSGWLPTGTEATEFSVPRDYDIRPELLRIPSNKRLPTGVSAEDGCIHITGETKSNNARVAWPYPSSGFPKNYETTTKTIPWNDARVDAVKKVLLKHWGYMYNEHTMVRLREVAGK